jgi:hypothetical protein
MLSVCQETCDVCGAAADEAVAATPAVELNSKPAETAAAMKRDPWRMRITPAGANLADGGDSRDWNSPRKCHRSTLSTLTSSNALGSHCR